MVWRTTVKKRGKELMMVWTETFLLEYSYDFRSFKTDENCWRTHSLMFYHENLSSTSFLPGCCAIVGQYILCSTWPGSERHQQQNKMKDRSSWWRAADFQFSCTWPAIGWLQLICRQGHWHRSKLQPHQSITTLNSAHVWAEWLCLQIQACGFSGFTWSFHKAGPKYICYTQVHPEQDPSMKINGACWHRPNPLLPARHSGAWLGVSICNSYACT